MTKGKLSDEEVTNAINEALNNTSLDDNEIEKYFEGMFDVITGKIQAKTAASKYKLNVKQLSTLADLVKKNLDGNNEAVEEENATDTDGNDENTVDDKNLEQEIDEEEEGKNAKDALKKAEDKKNKQKAAKKENDKKGKSSKKVAVEPQKLPKKRRKKNEEFLIEEANMNVFKGKDPDNQALALVLQSTFNDNGGTPAKSHPGEESEEMAPTPMGTRSRRSLANANLQQKALMIWNGKASNETANNIPIQQSTSSSQSSNQSMQLVKYLPPKASKARIELVKPNKKVASKKKSKENGNSAVNRTFIKFNSRWTEYRKMAEDIVDDVLTGMQTRNNEEKLKKTSMRVGILDVLFVQISIAKASVEQGVGLSTIRRYCKEVKIRLDKYLGEDVVDDQFLRQFENYKQNVTLDHFREAMRRAKKEIPSANEVKKQPRKRPAPRNSSTTETPKKTKKSGNENDSMSPLAAKRARYSYLNPIANSGQKALAKVVGGSNKPSNSPVKNVAGAGTSNGGNGIGKENNAGNAIGTVATLKDGQALHLMTSQQRDRKPISGTPAQIRKMVYDFFKGRYQGDVDVLSNYLTDLLVADARLKRHADECPIQILYSGYSMFGRFFQVENVQLVDNDDD